MPSTSSPAPTPCPICRKDAAPRPDNAAHPFCSSRCQLIDLGQWLDGRYRFAGEPADVIPIDDLESD